MSSSSKNVNNQAERSSGADLRGQYRPIGIGAVAAALSVAGKQPEPPGAANSNERNVERDSLAA